MLVSFMYQSVYDGTLPIGIILLRNLLVILLLIRIDTNVGIEVWQNVARRYCKLSNINYVPHYTERRKTSV